VFQKVRILLLAVTAGALAGACDRPMVEPNEDRLAPSFHSEDGSNHSHGRYSHITWVPRPDIGTYAVEFTYQAAFRRGYSTCYQWSGAAFTTTACTGPNGRAGTGDIIRETIANGGSALRFGDGGTTGVLHFLVTSTNPSSTTIEDWIFVVALDPATGTPNIVRQYAGPGPYTAENYDCCRIGGLRNSGSNYGVQTLVTPGAGVVSAVSNLPPIVNVPQGGDRTWLVPAASPAGRTLRWSLTSPATTVGGAQPAGMSIDPNTGLVTWTTDGRALGYYWSNITIEELDGGTVVGSVAVDYLIHLVAEDLANNPPVFTEPGFCSSSLSATINQLVSFNVGATDPDVGNLITLVGSGIPAGATFLPPAPANPISASFSWTPTTAGPRLITFVATDPAGAQALCAVTINVQQSAPPSADPGGPYTGDEGSSVAFDGTGSSDPENRPITYEWDFGDGHTATGATPTHTYVDNGIYTVQLTVTAGSQTNVETTTATIANVVPTVNAGADASINPGQSYMLAATFSDPGIIDAPWTYLIDWGDGTTASGTTSDQSASITGSHLYASEGNYEIMVTVTDKDGGIGSDALLLTVGAASGVPEGCTPGFWSQNGIRRNAWPSGYAPADLTSGVFSGATGHLGSATLLEALEGYRGPRSSRNTVEGASEILLRAAVAAVLNAEVFGASYGAQSAAWIRTAVNDALDSSNRQVILDLAAQLDAWNNSGSCPLP
jgi:hypothetical protein